VITKTTGIAKSKNKAAVIVGIKEFLNLLVSVQIIIKTKEKK